MPPQHVLAPAGLVQAPEQKDDIREIRSGTPAPLPPSSGQVAHGELYKGKNHTTFGWSRGNRGTAIPDKQVSGKPGMERTVSRQPASNSAAASSIKPAPVSIPTSHVGNLLGDTDKETFWLNLKIIESLVIDKQEPLPESDIDNLLNAASAVQRLNQQCKATLDLISLPGNQTDPALVKSLYDRIGQFDRGIHLMVESALNRASPAGNRTAMPSAPANDTGQAPGKTVQLDVMDSLGRIRRITDRADSEHRALDDHELAEIQALVANIAERSPSDEQQFTNPDEMLASVLREVHEHQAAYAQGASAAQRSNLSEKFHDSFSEIERFLTAARGKNRDLTGGEIDIINEHLDSMHDIVRARSPEMNNADQTKVLESALAVIRRKVSLYIQARAQVNTPANTPLATNTFFAADSPASQRNAAKEAGHQMARSFRAIGKGLSRISGAIEPARPSRQGISSRLAGTKRFFGTSSFRFLSDTNALEEAPRSGKKNRDSSRKFGLATSLFSKANWAGKAHAASPFVPDDSDDDDIYARAFAATRASQNNSATDIDTPITQSGPEEDETATVMSDLSIPVDTRIREFKANDNTSMARRAYTPSELSEPVGDY